MSGDPIEQFGNGELFGNDFPFGGNGSLGRGIVGGDVTIADGAALSPGDVDGTPGTLTIAGNLTLSGGSTLNYSVGEANVAGSALNDLTVVGGDIVLTCLPGGCLVPLTFNGEAVTALRSATLLKVNVQSINAKEVPLSISLKGLAAALDRLEALGGI